MDEKSFIEFFKRIIETKNSAAIDDAISMAASTTKLKSAVPYLCQLLESHWHFNHESIAILLQQIADPTTINTLFQTATKKFDYLDYDNSYPLSRKCTWALADIGTVEAKEALNKLAANSDQKIAGYAEKRIKNWDNEMGRKKHSNKY